MARILAVLAPLVLLPGVLAAQVPESDTTASAPDTTAVTAVAPDTSVVGVRPRFTAPGLKLEQPGILRVPGLGTPRSLPALRAAAWDSSVAALLDSTRIERELARRYRNLYGVRREDLLQPRSDDAEEKGILGISRKYADLALEGQARIEIRTERNRNERCTPVQLLDPNSGCRGGFKAPRLDNQFAVRAGGVIGQRLDVNVDYDAQRDAGSSQTIQVFYQGLEDEIVRRVEVGTVAFIAPRSRFLTAAIPSNNFGVNARFELGPVQLQALAATQSGNVVAERTYTVGQNASQAQDRQLRDLDYDAGRFFWVIDPTALPDYPAVDILNVAQLPVDPSRRPAQVRVYRYRTPGATGADPNLGGITAVARRSDAPAERTAAVQWLRLTEGTDYFVDQSGLWIALATKVGENDFLAVSYVTAAGDTVGSFPERDAGAASRDSLELISQPLQGPAQATFKHEMRQIYRVAGSDLEVPSLQVNVTLNRSERPQSGAAPTYLQLFGLALPTDANLFDLENRLFPGARTPNAVQILKESYIVFPHLRPFADAGRLTPVERSDSLYRTPQYLQLSQGPGSRFAIGLRYNSTGGGDRGSLNLNALQIRENSEQLRLGGRVLERGVDYSIEYGTGVVTFLNPELLFPSAGAVQITAKFEERGIFAVAPTTILGFTTRYAIGERGAINLVGLYQSEASAYNRPALGFESSTHLVGGATAEFRFRPNGVTRFLDKLTAAPATAPSALDVNAEVAFTRPDPNRSGQAYIESFDGEAGIPVALRESSWEFGSMPSATDGVQDMGFGVAFDSLDAVQLTWQNLIPACNGCNQALELRPQDIDPSIRIQGRGEMLETVLYLTFHADTAGGLLAPPPSNASRWSLPQRDFRPRWRSIVTPLSPTGVDLSKNEYLEFWVFDQPRSSAATAGLRLMLDLGTVDEDALAIAPESLTVTGADSVFSGRQFVGVGRLDTEMQRGGIFDASTDDVGILGDHPDVLVENGVPLDGGPPLCLQLLTAQVQIFRWGDLDSRCTAGNGQLDTEDLNSDRVLNASGDREDVNRYIVDLAALSKYYVRDGARDTASGTTWRLYRVPLRAPDIVVGAPNLRLAKQLRITLVAPTDAGGPDPIVQIALARMKFTGSPWVRRSETPIRGIAGALGEPHGAVISSVISTEDSILGYESPPGVIDAGNLRGPSAETQGTQINEKSLRLVAQGLGPGERAEAYLRFPGGPQNLLNYRQLRLWARGKGPGWDDKTLRYYVKLGSDNENFYLYRAETITGAWSPEAIVDLETWRRLRAQVENAWLAGQAPSGAAECGLDPEDPASRNAYIACEGPYLVHVGSPGVAPPNLAAVQEISTGILHAVGEVPIGETELWIDDIRVTNPIAETGTAIAIDTRLAASDVGDVTLSFIRQDGQFRQIGQTPSYRTTSAMQLGTSLRLDRFLPSSLGLSVPASVTYARTGVDPQLLSGTDVRGDALENLRKPEGWSATYSIAVRRSARGKDWLTRGFIDPLQLSFAMTQGRTRSELSDGSASTRRIDARYNLSMSRGGFRLPLGDLLNILPDWLRNSEAGKGLERTTFSLVPTSLRFSSGLTHDQSDFTSYDAPIVRPDDATRFTPTRSLTQLWRNQAGLTWQPLGMLTLSGDLASTRDLRHYADSTELGRLANESRQSFLGQDVGVERDRTLTTALLLSPRIASWLRPRFGTSSSFVLARSLTTRAPVQEFGDTAGAFFLPQTLNNSRANEYGLAFDVARASRSFFGDSSGVARALARVRPVDVSHRTSLVSTYDLAAFDPSLSYQLALGGLANFLTQEGQPAIGVSQSENTTLASGAELPFGISATVSYSRIGTTRWQQVAGGFQQTLSDQVEWPAGTVRLNRSLNRGPISFFVIGATFRKREGTITQPQAESEATINATTSSSLTPDFQVTLRNGMSFVFGLNSLEQTTVANGNTTVLDQRDFTATFNHSFRLPEMISRTRKTLRSSLSLLTQHAESCLLEPDAPECRTVSETLRKEIRAGLDTELMRMLTGGIQVGYTLNDAVTIQQRSSQLYLLASLQLSLFAGDYR